MRTDVVAERAAALRAQRVPFVHARVVLAERPTSAKPGAEAVIFADGTIEGFVGGTCAESTVRAQSLALLDSGEPLLLRICPEPEAPQPGRLTVHNPCLSGGTLEIFLQPVIPAPLLVVVGETPIAAALAELAAALGYQVERRDPRNGVDVVPEVAAAVVVASHGRDEEPVLAAALQAGTPYVGLVASRKRGEAVLLSLDVDAAARTQVHTPAGLDIGARTPEEVALSILAEVVSERRRPSGRPITLDLEPVGPATAIDLICGMSVAMVDSSLHLDHEGTRYWFCGSGCLRAFAADPASYVPA
ncbi:MAG TPA: XdhC family protein [Actinomycetes bacterium]